jgi:Ca2+/H+ antiporter
MLVVGILAIGLSPGNGPYGAGQALAMIGLAAIYIVPSYFLSQYASAIGKLNVSRQDGDLETALRWQKSFWKFSGIFAIVVICLYAILIFLFVVLRARF